jgi:hypothetical protein
MAMYVRVAVNMVVVMMPMAVIWAMGLCGGSEKSTKAKSQCGCGNQGQCNAFHNRDPFKLSILEGEGWVVIVRPRSGINACVVPLGRRIEGKPLSVIGLRVWHGGTGHARNVIKVSALACKNDMSQRGNLAARKKSRRREARSRDRGVSGCFCQGA